MNNVPAVTNARPNTASGSVPLPVNGNVPVLVEVPDAPAVVTVDGSVVEVDPSVPIVVEVVDVLVLDVSFAIVVVDPCSPMVVVVVVGSVDVSLAIVVEVVGWTVVVVVGSTVVLVLVDVDVLVVDVLVDVLVVDVSFAMVVDVVGATVVVDVEVVGAVVDVDVLVEVLVDVDVDVDGAVVVVVDVGVPGHTCVTLKCCVGSGSVTTAVASTNVSVSGTLEITANFGFEFTVASTVPADWKVALSETNALPADIGSTKTQPVP